MTFYYGADKLLKMNQDVKTWEHLLPLAICYQNLRATSFSAALGVDPLSFTGSGSDPGWRRAAGR